MFYYVIWLPPEFNVSEDVYFSPEGHKEMSSILADQ
jgi:hypothetical protein